MAGDDEGQQGQARAKLRTRSQRAVEIGKRAALLDKHSRPQSRNRPPTQDPGSSKIVTSPALTAVRAIVAERIAQQIAAAAEQSIDDSDLQVSATKPIATLPLSAIASASSSTPVSGMKLSPTNLLAFTVAGKGLCKVPRRRVGPATQTWHSGLTDEIESRGERCISAGRGVRARPLSANCNRRAARPLSALTSSSYSSTNQRSAVEAAEVREPNAPSSARQSVRHADLHVQTQGPFVNVAALLPLLECARTSQPKPQALEPQEPPQLQSEPLQTPQAPLTSHLEEGSSGQCKDTTARQDEPLKDTVEPSAEAKAQPPCTGSEQVRSLMLVRPAPASVPEKHPQSGQCCACGPFFGMRCRCSKGSEHPEKHAEGAAERGRRPNMQWKKGRPQRIGTTRVLPFDYSASDPRCRHVDEAEEERPPGDFPPILAVLWMSTG
mmetsp:Transcript_106000/g.192887  ORF Transcript_106000/g.192887 Transcript_106000/m.192887 type:complete len:438 (-) Transcript_106000:205-1518(-)